MIPRASLVGAVLLPLLAACGSGPRRDFEEDLTVHFILKRTRPPTENTTLKPVFTVGESVVRAPEVRFGPDDALACEAAVVRAPRSAKTRISFWDPVTRTQARSTIDFRHELWVVVDIDNLGGESWFDVSKRPPNRSLAGWEPLTRIAE